jgi:quercetin dioxygenase-like cupin family protein
MHGDPGKDGIFTMRLRLPAGAGIEPHWHTGDEQLTVISGTFYAAGSRT